LGFAALLLVSLTSCAVKGSIKSWLGIPTQTEQSLPKANYHFTVSTIDQCAEIENATTQIAQKIAFSAHDLLPAIISTATLQSLLSFRPVNNEIKHPVYSGSAKIRSSVPIYLEYRKLMIYFAR
jgi:hypothetical protein